MHLVPIVSIYHYYMQRAQSYEDGEILVESEPTRYELKITKFKTFGTSTNRTLTVLGSAILINYEAESQQIEAEIGYKYDHEQYWGVLEGVSVGTPTKVFELNKTPVDIFWGIKNPSVKEKVCVCVCVKSAFYF